MSEPTIKDLSAALADLPIFPLPQVVLFPHAMLPLHVFEPRYRAMLKDCLATHKAMAIARIADPNDTDGRDPQIASIAGVGVIVEHQALPDGRSAILLQGIARVRLEELPFVPPYRRARATLLEDAHVVVPPEERLALVAASSAFAAEVHKRDSNFSFRLPPNLEVGVLADLSAHHLVIDAEVRQEILEERDPVERVRKVATALTLQHSRLAREGGRGPELKLVGRVPLALLRQGDLVRLPYPPWHVLVTMVRGVPAAIEDSCNHAGASLAEGSRQGDRVACPMHGYVFDLASGELVAPVGLCDHQRRFTVVVEGEDAVVFDPFEVKILG